MNTVKLKTSGNALEVIPVTLTPDQQSEEMELQSLLSSVMMQALQLVMGAMQTATLKQAINELIQVGQTQVYAQLIEVTAF